MRNPNNHFSMKYMLLAIGLFSITLSFSQTKAPVEVTPVLQKNIMLEIDKEIPNLKQLLEKAKENAVHVEFTVDTFRIEYFMEKWIALDNGDFGMRDAGYAAAAVLQKSGRRNK